MLSQKDVLKKKQEHLEKTTREYAQKGYTTVLTDYPIGNTTVDLLLENKYGRVIGFGYIYEGGGTTVKEHLKASRDAFLKEFDGRVEAFYLTMINEPKPKMPEIKIEGIEQILFQKVEERVDEIRKSLNLIKLVDVRGVIFDETAIDNHLNASVKGSAVLKLWERIDTEEMKGEMLGDVYLYFELNINPKREISNFKMTFDFN